MWKVTDDAGEISSPEAEDSLVGKSPCDAILDTRVALAQLALLEELILILKQQFDPLDRGGARF